MTWSSRQRYFRDSQQFCLTGHRITVAYHNSPRTRKDFCPECGEGTIHECQKCGAGIPGQLYEYGDPKYNASLILTPNNCEKCGNAFPWAITEEPALASPPSAIEKIEEMCRRF